MDSCLRRNDNYMIKFFRKIRQSLIKENKFSRYLLYAIGEIFLVVIGILIALQINNWNESRKNKQKEQQLIFNLKIEFEDNLRDLDSISKDVDSVIVALEKVFQLFSPEVYTIDQNKVDKLFSDALSSPSWRPSQYLLNTLGASGSISELKNENLKLLLYRWSRLKNEMQEVDQRTEKTGEEIISYLKHNGTLRNIDVNSETFNYKKTNLNIENTKLLSDPVFENHIDDKLFMYGLTKNILKDARQLIIKLIEECERSYD